MRSLAAFIIILSVFEFSAHTAQARICGLSRWPGADVAIGDVNDYAKTLDPIKAEGGAVVAARLDVLRVLVLS